MASIDGSGGRPSRSWRQVYDDLARVDAAAPLDATGLEHLAVAAYLVGEDDAAADAWTRAHRALLDAGELARAARCGFLLGWSLYYKGQMARCDGWFRRAQRLVDEVGDCAEAGLLLVPLGVEQVFGNAPEAGLDTFTRICEIGERFGDPDTIAFGRLGRGEALIRLGDVAAGVGLLDEVMVSVTAGELTPLVAGTVYCAVLLQCQATFDLARAVEWTDALTAWSADPDMVPYRGQCMVHRSEILQLRGAWPQALEEAERAHELFLRPPAQPAVGMASYQQGELHRLRGELAAAERLYAEASHWGHEPQPGLSLLRLAQDRAGDAAAAIRRAVDREHDRLTRTRMLSAFVTIMLAVDDLPAARQGADELATIAESLDAPLLRAESARATGTVLLAEGDVEGAVAALRNASLLWQRLDAPYETARTRAAIGLACRRLGDEDSARLELAAARSTLHELGALTDLAVLDRLAPEPADGNPLSRREREVLALVATGRTNRAIADELFISEKTVERHVSNIFTKLGVTNRAAATAHAYEHGLLPAALRDSP